MFCLILADWPIKDITEAFLDWTEENQEVPTPADILKLCAENASRRKGSSTYTGEKARWTQSVLDWHTNDELAVNPSGSHLSPFQISQQFAGQTTYTRYGREK